MVGVLVQEGDAIYILTSHSLLPSALVAPARHSASCFVCIWGPPGQCLVIIPGDLLETMQCWGANWAFYKQGNVLSPLSRPSAPQLPSVGALGIPMQFMWLFSCSKPISHTAMVILHGSQYLDRVQNFVLFSGYTQQCSAVFS